MFIKCFSIFNHKYKKFGEPYKVYGGHWKQSRVCVKCGRVDTIDIGFIQADVVIYAGKE
jgi:hypothetical protein